MLAIPLSNRPGIFTLISECDLLLISPYRWRLSTNGYVVATIQGPRNSRIIYLHRLLLNPPPGLQVDHIWGDKLDNRRESLRLATRAENQRSRHTAAHSSTGFRGVTRTRWGTFQASLKLNGKTIHLGTHVALETAALVRDAGARRFHGDFAFLNCPDMPTPSEIEVLLDHVLTGKSPTRPAIRPILLNNSLSERTAPLHNQIALCVALEIVVQVAHQLTDVPELLAAICPKCHVQIGSYPDTTRDQLFLALYEIEGYEAVRLAFERIKSTHTYISFNPPEKQT